MMQPVLMARLYAAVARLVKEVFDTAAGLDAVNAVSDYLRSQRVTSLADLQVSLSSSSRPFSDV